MEPLNETKNSQTLACFRRLLKPKFRLAELTSSIWSRVFDKPSPKWRSPSFDAPAPFISLARGRSRTPSFIVITNGSLAAKSTSRVWTDMTIVCMRKRRLSFA